MASQYSVKLAVELISQHFGDLVAKVCGCLLRRGTLSLQEITRFTEIPGSQVKNCLFVLIQHNCVQAFSLPAARDKTVTQYMAILDNVLHRMRFAKFLLIVKEELGSEAEALLEGLLKNGRLTFEQIVDRSISGSTGESSTTLEKKKEVRACFNKLVCLHYVERCPRPDPFIDPDSEDQPKPTKRRGAKFSEETFLLEKQAMAAASLTDGERFLEIPEISVEKSDIDSDDKSALGNKRKHGYLEGDEDLQVAIAETEVLWRANYEKFLFCLKKKVCAENVRARLGLDAGIVLESLIEASGEERVKDCNSVTASFSNILERLREKPGGVSMMLEHVRAVLDQLQCNSSSNDSSASFSLDLNGVIEACQTDEVEELVKARFGQVAYRIFRLLATRGIPAETDRIAEVAFIEKKEAEQTLYKLWKDEYLDTYTVKVPPASGFGSVEVFLWSVKKKSLYSHVLDDMYHSALNLTIKISQLDEQEHEVSVADKTQWIKRKLILQLSLLKLDDSLMLFHDFSNYR